MDRQMLVVTLHCEKCKSPLSFDRCKGVARSVDSQPTGGAMVDLALTVAPCQCTTRESERLKTAFRAFMDTPQ